MRSGAADGDAALKYQAFLPFTQKYQLFFYGCICTKSYVMGGGDLSKQSPLRQLSKWYE